LSQYFTPLRPVLVGRHNIRSIEWWERQDTFEPTINQLRDCAASTPGACASRTEPVQFKILSGQAESVGGGDLMPQMFNGGIFELDDFPAVRTAQVVMVTL
jgi:hypothetical protein